MKKYWLVVAGKKKQLIKSKKKKNNGWYCFYHRNLQPFRKPEFKARLKFIHAAEMAEGKSYEMKKEELGYKKRGAGCSSGSDSIRKLPNICIK